MAVDKGYGSGYKNTGKAKPAAPRARRARGSAKPNTPLSQMSKAEYNARIVQGQAARRRANGNFSDNLLEAFTGFNKKDGVDAGDFAGLAISIPTGGIGGALLRAGARAVVPKAARIAGAAKRVAAQSGRAAKTFQAAEDARISRLNSVDDQIQSLRRSDYVGSDYFRTTTRMTDPLFDTWERSSTLVGDGPSAWQKAKDLASKTGKRVVARRGDNFGDISTTNYALEPSERALSEASELEYQLKKMRNEKNDYFGYRAIKAKGRSNIDEASREIKRRLAALQRAKRNR